MARDTGFVNILDVITSEGFYQEMMEHAKIEQAFLAAKTPQEQWPIIRKIYEKLTPEIMAYAADGYLGHTDPYYVDWCKRMTPIEYAGWCSIRCKGMGLYPQYPVLNYFLDFANPYLKIAVEMDGKDFHDLEKDQQRDKRLLDEGWFVFRIEGRECYTRHKPLWEMEDGREYSESHKREVAEKYYCETSDGVFEAIEIAYFREGGCDHKYIDLIILSLNMHRIVYFDPTEKIKGYNARW